MFGHSYLFILNFYTNEKIHLFDSLRFICSFGYYSPRTAFADVPSQWRYFNHDGCRSRIRSIKMGSWSKQHGRL